LQDYYSSHNRLDSIRPPNHSSAEDLCREIILSYRLIFGLDQPSRKLFRKECANEMRLSSDFDPLLSVLCGQKWDSPSSISIFEEIDADPPASFYLTSDFPLFGHKLFKLHNFVQRQYPSSIRTLWYVTHPLISGETNLSQDGQEKYDPVVHVLGSFDTYVTVSSSTTAC
jgi:hypothetical protein